MDKVNKILESISKKFLVSKYSAVPNTEDRGQRTENRGQRTEDRRQRAEGRRPGFALKASPRQAEDPASP